MSLREFDVYEFAEMDKEYLWTHENEKIVLHFPEGEPIVCYWRQAVLSIPCWKPFRELKWLRPHLTKDFVIPFPMGKGSLEKMFNKVLSHMRNFKERHDVDEPTIANIIYLEINKVFNDSIKYLTPYIPSTGARELREIIHHPEIDKIYQRLKNGEIRIKDAYKQGDEIIRNSPIFKDNTLAREARYGIVDSKQFNQVYMARGVCTDIDNVQFKDPVLSSYGRGIHNILWSAQESRGASIAAIQAKDPVQSSDYLNRRLQIMTGIFDKVYPGDCGTTETIPWAINNKDDLDAATGCFIKDGTVFRPITQQDKQLIGTTVELRTMACCHKLHEYGVCETCLGLVSDSIPKDFSIGHISIIGALGDFVQKSLSAKHLIVSREVETFELDATTSKYLRFPRKDVIDELMIQTKLLNNPKWKEISLTFDSRDIPFLADLESNISVDDIQVSNLQVSNCSISLSDKSREVIIEPLNLSDRSRCARLSRDFVNYIAENRDLVDTTRTNKVTVILSPEKWDNKSILFTIPHKISSVEDFMKSFESTIKSAGRHGIDANKPVGISDMMRMCYDIVMGVVGIPVSHLGAMISSLLVRDAKNMDYRPPLPGGNRDFETMGNIFGYRSLSQLLAYEKRPQYFKSPIMTLAKIRANHPFDGLFFPESYNIYEDVEKALERGTYHDDFMPVPKEDDTSSTVDLTKL